MNNRFKKTIENMIKLNLPQIIVSSPSSLFYLTGIEADPHERLLALYINIDGKIVLFANEIFGINYLDNVQVILHSDKDNPVFDIAKTVDKGNLGIDKFWASKFLISLMDLRNDISPKHGSKPIDLARAFKDEEEQKLMKAASKINDMVMEKAISAIKEGISEKELESYINKLYRDFGAERENSLVVSFGKNCANPHHIPDNTLVSSDDSIVLDIFTPIKKYWCDMTRTVFYKSADETSKKIYDLVLKANEEAEKIIKPGIKLKEIDFAGRKIISESGYGEYFTHRIGHNIGIDCHEYPDVSEISEFLIEPGMVFSIEPGIYLPEKLGVRIEDLVLVTENGYEVLNDFPKDLIIIK